MAPVGGPGTEVVLELGAADIDRAIWSNSPGAGALYPLQSRMVRRLLFDYSSFVGTDREDLAVTGWREALREIYPAWPAQVEKWVQALLECARGDQASRSAAPSRRFSVRACSRVST